MSALHLPSVVVLEKTRRTLRLGLTRLPVNHQLYFRVEVIRRALAEVRRRDMLVTDDTAACELIGQPVQLVLSPQPNPKVTRPEDLPYIEAMLCSMAHEAGAVNLERAVESRQTR
jgi:hypothetical protein